MRDGDFAAAWAVNDQVLACRDPATRDDPSRPYHERWVWDGRPLRGRRVLVRCYHGLGDTLQFSRYLPALRARASRVTLETQPELAALLRGLPADRIHPFDPASPLPPAECDVEIMELGHALRLAPDPSPYLRVSPLPGPGGRVGFCWRSGAWDRARDVPVDTLRSVAGIPGLKAVSLQRGPAAAEAALLGAHDPLRGSMDIQMVAALIAGLGAVVTVDSMIAHLAAALGRPTFVLLKHDPDWRWGGPAHGSGTPWYAAARTYRQSASGDWAGAVACLQHELYATLRRNGGL